MLKKKYLSKKVVSTTFFDPKIPYKKIQTNFCPKKCWAQKYGSKKFKVKKCKGNFSAKIFLSPEPLELKF